MGVPVGLCTGRIFPVEYRCKTTDIFLQFCGQFDFHDPPRGLCIYRCDFGVFQHDLPVLSDRYQILHMVHMLCLSSRFQQPCWYPPQRLHICSAAILQYLRDSSKQPSRGRSESLRLRPASYPVLIIFPMPCQYHLHRSHSQLFYLQTQHPVWLNRDDPVIRHCIFSNKETYSI